MQEKKEGFVAHLIMYSLKKYYLVDHFFFWPVFWFFHNHVKSLSAFFPRDFNVFLVYICLSLTYSLSHFFTQFYSTSDIIIRIKWRFQNQWWIRLRYPLSIPFAAGFWWRKQIRLLYLLTFLMFLIFEGLQVKQNAVVQELGERLQLH